MTLKLYGLKEIPLVKKGDDIAKIIEEDLEKEDIALEDGEDYSEAQSSIFALFEKLGITEGFERTSYMELLEKI